MHCINREGGGGAGGAGGAGVHANIVAMRGVHGHARETKSDTERHEFVRAMRTRPSSDKVPSPSNYRPENFPENIVSWSRDMGESRVRRQAGGGAGGERMARADFVGLAQRTFYGVLQPLYERDDRDKVLLDRAVALHRVMVERLFESQEASARLSLAISTMTADRDARITSLDRELQQERSTAQARIIELEYQLEEQHKSAHSAQRRHEAERERFMQDAASETSLLRDELAAITTRTQVKLGHSASTLEQTQEALLLAQAQHVRDAEFLRSLQQRLAVAEEEVTIRTQNLAHLEKARALNNELVAEADALQEARKVRMMKEVSFLESYKHDLAHTDSQIHALMHQNLQLTTHAARVEADLFDAGEEVTSLRQALAQHASAAKETQFRLTHEVKRLSYLVILCSAKISICISARSLAGWFSRVQYMRKLRSALVACRIILQRGAWVRTFRQLLRFTARRRFYSTVCRAVGIMRRRRLFSQWVCKNKALKKYHLCATRALARRAGLNRCLVGAAVRVWFQCVMHTKSLSSRLDGRWMVEDLSEVQHRIIQTGILNHSRITDVRLRPSSVLVSRLLTLTARVLQGVRIRSIREWRACARLLKKLAGWTLSWNWERARRLLAEWREHFKAKRKWKERLSKLSIRVIGANHFVAFQAWRNATREQREVHDYQHAALAHADRKFILMLLGTLRTSFETWKDHKRECIKSNPMPGTAGRVLTRIFVRYDAWSLSVIVTQWHRIRRRRPESTSPPRGKLLMTVGKIACYSPRRSSSDGNKRTPAWEVKNGPPVHDLALPEEAQQRALRQAAVLERRRLDNLAGVEAGGASRSQLGTWRSTESLSVEAHAGTHIALDAGFQHDLERKDFCNTDKYGLTAASWSRRPERKVGRSLEMRPEDAVSSSPLLFLRHSGSSSSFPVPPNAKYASSSSARAFEPHSRRSLYDSRQSSGVGTDSSVFDSGRIGGPNHLRETAMYEKTGATVNLANLAPSLSTNDVTPLTYSLALSLTRSLALTLARTHSGPPKQKGAEQAFRSISPSSPRQPML